MQLRGCGTALVTPFHQDGSIDEAALRNLIAWQVESGIDFLIPCGTTGETPTLSHDEWLRVIDTTVEVVAGRVPIVAGATSNSTQDAVEKARKLPRGRASMRSSLRRPTTTSPRRKDSTATSKRSRKRSTSRSFSTTCRAVPAPTSNRQPWRAFPRCPTSWA